MPLFLITLEEYNQIKDPFFKILNNVNFNPSILESEIIQGKKFKDRKIKRKNSSNVVFCCCFYSNRENSLK